MTGRAAGTTAPGEHRVPGTPEPSSDSRAVEPPDRTPLAAGADAWDAQVDQADRASDILRGQLDQYVNDGGSWVLGALGATALDVAGHAMTYTRSLADTARLGQGIAEGSWAGVREDASRLLNVLPQGRIATVLDLGPRAMNVVDAAAQGDGKGGAMAAAGIVLGAAAKKPSALVVGGGVGVRGTCRGR